jgi:hypothetical protein
LVEWDIARYPGNAGRYLGDKSCTGKRMLLLFYRVVSKNDFISGIVNKRAV